jgi:hypothetical protein
MKCLYCKKLGHMIKDCKVRIANERKGERRKAQGNVIFHK